MITMKSKSQLILWGTSSDEKPTSTYGSKKVLNASMFHETDSGDSYMFDAETATWWLRVPKQYADTDESSITLFGLDKDPKPQDRYGSLKLIDGAIFYTIDTNEKYRYDKESKGWYKQTPISSGGGTTGNLDVDVYGERVSFFYIN